MDMKKQKNIDLNAWWSKLDIWGREWLSGYLVENYDGETELYLEATDEWWESLTDAYKVIVYNRFKNEY